MVGTFLSLSEYINGVSIEREKDRRIFLLRCYLSCKVVEFVRPQTQLISDRQVEVWSSNNSCSKFTSTATATINSEQIDANRWFLNGLER